MAYLPPIVIIDDEDDDMFITKRLLTKAGVENKSIAFQEARLAIGYLEAEIRNKNDLLIPFLILTDLKMPMMNGFELITWIRAQAALKKTYVVALTTSENTADLKQALSLGADRCVTKFPTASGFRQLVETAGGSLTPLQ